jgi:aspartyl-tRNA(Asn)/glutamyl-tRNA(Gln) amidotransferase subunit A
MAQDVRDCAIMLEAMAGFDPKDSTSLDLPVPKWEANLACGRPRQADRHPEGISDRRRSRGDRPRLGAGHRLDARCGAEIVEVSLPHTKYALPTYYIIAPAEASSNLARYDGVKYGLREQPDNCSLRTCTRRRARPASEPEVKRRIMIGTYVLSAGFYDAYFNQAQKVRAPDRPRLRTGLGRMRSAADARPRPRPPSRSARSRTIQSPCI